MNCCRLPFGKLHQSNPEVIQLARIIGRTPSAVAMKACNFASLDPALAQKGLPAASKADHMLWDAFMANSIDIADKAEALFETCVEKIVPNEDPLEASFNLLSGATETTNEIKVRRIQRFFCQAVLQSYDNRCAISGLAIPELLVASHIIPWAKDETRRADPTNGIALNALYDKAFDRGLITFDDDFRLILSSSIKARKKDEFITQYFIRLEGRLMTIPSRFKPDLQSMSYHRNYIFALKI